MATVRAKAGKKGQKNSRVPPPENGAEVLTLADAAAYLRVPESEVLTFILDQGLPARKAEEGWRLLKEAVQDWLRNAPRPKKGIWASSGVFKDDPDLEEIVKDAYRRRGRQNAEDD